MTNQEKQPVRSESASSSVAVVGRNVITPTMSQSHPGDGTITPQEVYESAVAANITTEGIPQDVDEYGYKLPSPARSFDQIVGGGNSSIPQDEEGLAWENKYVPSTYNETHPFGRLAQEPSEYPVYADCSPVNGVEKARSEHSNSSLPVRVSGNTSIDSDHIYPIVTPRYTNTSSSSSPIIRTSPIVSPAPIIRSTANIMSIPIRLSDSEDDNQYGLPLTVPPTVNATSHQPPQQLGFGFDQHHLHPSTSNVDGDIDRPEAAEVITFNPEASPHVRDSELYFKPVLNSTDPLGSSGVVAATVGGNDDMKSPIQCGAMPNPTLFGVPPATQDLFNKSVSQPQTTIGSGSNHQIPLGTAFPLPVPSTTMPVAEGQNQMSFGTFPPVPATTMPVREGHNQISFGTFPPVPATTMPVGSSLNQTTASGAVGSVQSPSFGSFSNLSHTPSSAPLSAYQSEPGIGLVGTNDVPVHTSTENQAQFPTPEREVIVIDDTSSDVRSAQREIKETQAENFSESECPSISESDSMLSGKVPLPTSNSMFDPYNPVEDTNVPTIIPSETPKSTFVVNSADSFFAARAANQTSYEIHRFNRAESQLITKLPLGGYISSPISYPDSKDVPKAVIDSEKLPNQINTANQNDNRESIDSALDAAGPLDQNDNRKSIDSVLDAVGPLDQNDNRKSIDSVLDAAGPLDQNENRKSIDSVLDAAGPLDQNDNRKSIDSVLDAAGLLDHNDNRKSIDSVLDAAGLLDHNDNRKSIDSVLDAAGPLDQSENNNRDSMDSVLDAAAPAEVSEAEEKITVIPTIDADRNNDVTPVHGDSCTPIDESDSGISTPVISVSRAVSSQSSCQFQTPRSAGTPMSLRSAISDNDVCGSDNDVADVPVPVATTGLTTEKASASVEMVTTVAESATVTTIPVIASIPNKKTVTIESSITIIPQTENGSVSIGGVPDPSSVIDVNAESLNKIAIPTQVPKSATDSLINDTNSTIRSASHSVSTHVTDPQNPLVGDYSGSDDVTVWITAILEHLQAADARIEAETRAREQALMAKKRYMEAKAQCERDIDDMMAIQRLAAVLLNETYGAPHPQYPFKLTEEQAEVAREMLSHHHTRLTTLKTTLVQSSVHLTTTLVKDQRDMIEAVRRDLSRASFSLTDVANNAFGGWIKMIETMMCYISERLTNIDSTLQAMSITDVRSRYMALQSEVSVLLQQLAVLQGVLGPVQH